MPLTCLFVCLYSQLPYAVDVAARYGRGVKGFLEE